MSRLRLALPVAALLVLALVPLPGLAEPPTAQSARQDGPPDVLVWTGTYGFRHPSITDAQLAITEMAQEGRFTATITENPAMLTGSVLREYDALMWVSTTGKPPMTDAQRDDVIRFAACGGATLGFHAALDANYGWAELAELFGAQFDSHPQNAGAGEVTMLVEDRAHPITEGWHDVDSFPFDDEYYRWRSAKAFPGVSGPRTLPGTHVLLSMDESTVAEGIQTSSIAYEHQQPIAWTRTFRDGGRVYYNNMGHSSGTWSLPAFRTALVNAVEWTTEVPLDTDCMDGDDPLPAGPAAPPATPALAHHDCLVPTIGERSGGTWESAGEAVRLTADGHTVDLAAGILGGLSWGAQTYVLDLRDVAAASADVTFTLTWPNPVDDYDLSITTAWGTYGSDANAGVTSEEVTITGVPSCSYLHVAGNNMLATGTAGPTLTATVDPGPAVAPTVTRIAAAGTDPSSLADGWAEELAGVACSCALLARDDDVADALAAGFAQAGGVPLLLTDGDALDAEVADTLQRLAISHVRVLGGEAAISEAVITELHDLGVETSRTAGETRIETAAAIARTDRAYGDPLLLRAHGSPEDPTSTFADALAAGRQAAADARPVLLTEGDRLSPATAGYLTDLAVDAVTVIGGEAAVGPQVVADLEALGITVNRVGGVTRAATAVAVATDLRGQSDAAAGGVLLLDGAAPTTWAEGFVAAGSPHAGPVVLADGDVLPEVTATWLGQADGTVPLTCGALVHPVACASAATALGLAD